MSQVISVLAKLKADTNSYVNGMKVADKATQDFKRGTKNVEESTKKAHGKMGESAIKMGTIVKGAILGFLTIQGGQFLKGAIKQASAFEAEAEGVKQMFGESATLVDAFAKNAASSAGLAETTALRFAKSFGGYAKSAGKAGDEAANFATSMVQAAGDLGSFYDLPTESALMAIQQGLRGEYEPLRRFNILLDENTIGQKAMAMGVSTTGKNLTQQQKVLVRQQAIMDGLGVAQGDFVKYADTYGNSIKTTSALFQNLQKDVGGALLPSMAKLSQALVPLIERLGPILKTAIEKLSPVIDAVSKALEYLIPILTPILDVVGLLAGSFALLVETVLPPLMQIITPIVDLFAKLMVPITDLINKLLPPLGTILDALAVVMQALITPLNDLIPKIAEMGTMLSGTFERLAPVISDMILFIGSFAATLLELIMPLTDIGKKLLPPLLRIFEKLLPVIYLVAKILLTLLLPVLELIITTIVPIVTGVADIIAWLVDRIADYIDWLWPYVQPVLNAIIDGINSVMKFLGFDTLPKLPEKLKVEAFNQGKDIGEAFKSGIDGAKPPALTGTGTPTGKGTGEQKKNPVTEFYKKMEDDIKQQQAKIKLVSMGVNDEIANMIVSSGEGWEKIYAKIQKGGSKAIKELGNKFAQTAAGMQKVSDIVQGTMSNIRDSMVGAFDVSKMGNSSKEIMGTARRLVERAKAFGMEIAELSKKKLNPTLLNQVIAAGPVEGLALARSLNTSDIGELNSLYNQVDATALATGKAVVGNEKQFIINVQGGIGDKNTIGKSIVEALKAYERTSGTGWRS
jgi:phage-related protein